MTGDAAVDFRGKVNTSVPYGFVDVLAPGTRAVGGPVAGGAKR